MFALDTKFQIRPGDLLIAEPFLPDPNFSRAVAYIVEHNEEGTIGFVLNQSTGVALKDVLPGEVGEELDIPLYSGGPVSPETLHVIHQLGDHISGSKYIARHTYWGGDFDQIKFLLGNKNANWKDFRFFVGYSGWSPGQLEAELEQKSWIIHRSNEELIFSDDAAEVWEKAMAERGGKYKLFAKSPLRPDWN